MQRERKELDEIKGDAKRDCGSTTRANREGDRKARDREEGCAALILDDIAKQIWGTVVRWCGRWNG